MEQEKNNFEKLWRYKMFIEVKELQQMWWEPYIKTKYYLKKLILTGKIPADRSEEEKKQVEEIVLYDWLKVCINPQNDPNIDFYFKKNKKKAKEEEIKKILFLDYKKDISLYRRVKEIFFEKGKLRDVFKENEWQIRLRKIRTWFLKRYDWGTAIKLHRSLANKSKFESLDLVFPRLLCATLVGFTPLLFDSETWKLPLRLSLIEIILTFLFSFIFIYIYLSYECLKVAGDEKNISIFRRVLPILLLGTIASFIFSFIFYGIYIFYVNSYFQWSSLKIITFFASVALFIGVLIQTIWEEKTVTEPL
jgi:hypothetical protein